MSEILLALSRDLGIIKTGEVLAFPGSISERSAKQIPASADELIRNIFDVMDSLVMSVIEKRNAAEFEKTRSETFPNYFRAVMALSALIRIMIPQAVIERLNQEFFSELEADFRDHGADAFGEAVRDQAIFTVWNLRKISDFMSQIANATVGPEVSENKDRLAEIMRLGGECIHHAVRTRFHIHCLISSMAMDRPIHRDTMDLVIDGLRSVVNAFSLARQLLDICVPISEPSAQPCEWDDEDVAMLREATYDLVGQEL